MPDHGLADPPENGITLLQVTEDEFLERFRPVPNHVTPRAGFDFGKGSCLFEVRGVDGDYIRCQDPDKVWMVIDGDDGLEIASGLHFVNRLGYLPPDKPCPPDTIITVPLDF